MTDPLTAARLSSQLLTGTPAGSAVVVCERLLAVQDQDLKGARLSVRARTRGLTVADVDRAMTEDRALVVSWFNRGTLHLVRREDFWWLHALTTPQLAQRTRRRLPEVGVTPDAAERAMTVLERVLAEEGPMTRDALREPFEREGIPTAGQAMPHLLGQAGLRGLAVRGPIVDGGHAFVLVRDWLGEPEPVDRDAALAELARRYLAGHAPADERDLARWAGIGLRDARAGFAAIAGSLVEREDGLFVLAGAEPAEAAAPPRLLGPFEPLLLGWCSRDAIVGEHRHLVTVNGIFKAFALVEGRAAGGWSLAGGRVRLEPFGELDAEVTAALDAEAADVERFVAAQTVTRTAPPRGPTPRPTGS